MGMNLILNANTRIPTSAIRNQVSSTTRKQIFLKANHQLLIHPQSTIDRPWSTSWLLPDWNLIKVDSQASVEWMHWLTLNGMSAKISQILTDCQPRCWSSVEQVLTIRCHWVSIEYELSANQGYWLRILVYTQLQMPSTCIWSAKLPYPNKIFKLCIKSIPVTHIKLLLQNCAWYTYRS